MKLIAALSLALFCLGCGGYGSNNSSTPQPGVVPAITQLSPDNANAGDPGFVLTVNGSSFATNAVIKWNGTVQTTTRLTAGQLTATIPATAIANAGTIPVTVTNPGTAGSPGGPYGGGGGGTRSETSNVMTFTVN